MRRAAATGSRSSPAAGTRPSCRHVVRLQGDRDGRLARSRQEVGRDRRRLRRQSRTGSRSPRPRSRTRRRLHVHVVDRRLLSRISRAASTRRRRCARSRTTRRTVGDVRRDEGEVRARGAAGVRQRRDRRASDVHRRVRATRAIAFRTGRIASRAAARCSRPAAPDDPMQLIDVRDLAEFMVHLIETEAAGSTTWRARRRRSRRGVLSRRGEGAQRRREVHVRRRLRFPRGAQDRGGDPVGDAARQRRRNDVGRNAKAIAAGLGSVRSPRRCAIRSPGGQRCPTRGREKPRFSITPDVEARAIADWKGRSSR